MTIEQAKPATTSARRPSTQIDTGPDSKGEPSGRELEGVLDFDPRHPVPCCPLPSVSAPLNLEHTYHRTGPRHPKLHPSSR